MPALPSVTAQITGQTAGVAVILSYLSGYSFGTVFFVINLPFYFFAWKRLGTEFTVKSLISVTLLSVLTDVDFFQDFIPKHRRDKYVAFVNIVKHFLTLHRFFKGNDQDLTNLIFIIIQCFLHITFSLGRFATFLTTEVQATDQFTNQHNVDTVTHYLFFQR